MPTSPIATLQVNGSNWPSALAAPLHAGWVAALAAAPSGGGDLTSLKVEGGTHTPSWVRAAPAPHNVLDTGTAAANRTGLQAAINTFGTVAGGLRALRPATVDLRGASIDLNSTVTIAQNWVSPDLDGTLIKSAITTGTLFLFDANNVNALNHAGVTGTFAIDGNSRTAPLVEVINTRFWSQTGGNAKFYDFQGNGVVFRGCVAPYMTAFGIRGFGDEPGMATTSPNSRGIVLTTSNQVPTGVGDSQRGVFGPHGYIYCTGREGVVSEGSGCHFFLGLDIEACGQSGTGIEASGIRVSRSFGNQMVCLYTEVNGTVANGRRDILVDNSNTATPNTTVTNSTFNLILGGYLTGSVEIAAGQSNVISAAAILGNLTIGSGASQTTIASGTQIVGALTDNGADTVKQAYTVAKNEMYIKAGTAKRQSTTVGTFVDHTSDYQSVRHARVRGISANGVQRNNLTGTQAVGSTVTTAGTTITVTLPNVETDANYLPILTARDTGGGVNVFVMLNSIPTINGFTVRVWSSANTNFAAFNWALIGN